MMLQQLFTVITYLAVLANVAFGTFLAALPADQKLAWWIGPAVAALNAVVHALPSDGLPLPTKTVAKASIVLLLAGLLGGCTGSSTSDLLGMSNDPHSGCAGFTVPIYGGNGWLLHLGKDTGDSGTVGAQGCTITAKGAANPNVNPVAGLPAGATMSVTLPPVVSAPAVPTK